MTPELRAALLAVHEARAALNAADEPTDELRSALTDADAALAELLRGEDPPDPIPVRDGPEEDAESRERRELRERASVARMLSLRASRSVVDGAEAEVAEAHGIPAGRIPVEMLFDLGDREERAASASGQVQATNTHPIAPNVFITDLAMRLGISTPTVPAGVQAYPYITGNASAGAALPGATDANNAQAAAVSVETIWPSRITGTVQWRVEDAVLLGDLETALRGNLRSVMEQAIDTQLISGAGDGSVDRGKNVTTAGLKGLLTQYPATEPTGADKAKAATAANVVSLVTGLLDGIYAERFGDLRLFSTPRAAQYLKGLLRIAQDPMDMLMWVENVASSFTSSARLSSTDAASGVAEYSPFLAHRTARGLGGIAPIWQGIETIVDEITGAAKGEIAVTLRMQMGGVLVLRDDAYVAGTLKTAAGL